MRIADGADFDPAGGVALLLPMTLDLQQNLRRIADMWSVARVDIEKGAAA